VRVYLTWEYDEPVEEGKRGGERVWATVVGVHHGHLRVRLDNKPLDRRYEYGEIITAHFVERDGVMMLMPNEPEDVQEARRKSAGDELAQ
jgi:hypothetical protein